MHSFPQIVISSKELFETMRARNIKLTVRWMPSHLLESGKTPPEGVSHTDILANDLADNQAGKAAKRHQISFNIATSFIYYHYLARRIQKRLTKIITSLPNRHRTKLPKQLFKTSPSLEDKFADSSHYPFIDHGKVRCAMCLDCLPSSGPFLTTWLKSKCMNFDVESNRPTPFHGEFIQIGKKTSHPSHHLFHFHGLAFCKKCGYYGKNRMINLAQRCEPPGQQGIANLAALMAGKLPNGLTSWPDQAPAPCSIEAGSLLRSAENATPDEVTALRNFAHDFSHYRISQEDQPTYVHRALATQVPITIPHRSSWAGFDDSQSDSSSE